MGYSELRIPHFYLYVDIRFLIYVVCKLSSSRVGSSRIEFHYEVINSLFTRTEIFRLHLHFAQDEKVTNIIYSEN